MLACAVAAAFFVFWLPASPLGVGTYRLTQRAPVNLSEPTSPPQPPPTATAQDGLAPVAGERHQVWADEFNGSAVDTNKWWIYDGPGNEGHGTRSPSRIHEVGGGVTIACTTDGKCGGMMARSTQQYGTWAARVKMSRASAGVHPVLLLWPNDDVWPGHGEVDYMEVADPTRRTADGFLHSGADDTQTHGGVNVDLTQWHVFSVTWTPSSIAYYVDGREWFKDTSTSHLPPVPMSPTIQLDEVGGPITRGGTVTVDWLRIYDR